MKTKYEFVNGEVVEIEISEEWAEVLKEMDRKEYNNDHAETRRHVTLDASFDASDWLIDEKADPAEIVSKRMMIKEGIDNLSECQREILINVCVIGISVAEYAELKGIGLTTAYYNLDRAKNNLKKFLEA